MRIPTLLLLLLGLLVAFPISAAVPAQANPALLRVVVTSDPQYPDIRQDLCPGCNAEQESARLIRQQYQSINDYHARHPVDAMFINGDYTNWGHGWQLEAMDGFRRTLKVPVYLGLGNHDYENNVDGCYANTCAASSLRLLYGHALQVADRFDAHKQAHYQFPAQRDVYTGSFAYSFTRGNIHFIQANNYVDYAVSFTAGLGAEEFHVRSSIHWLEDELSWARANGKVIVLNLHDPNKVTPELQMLMDRYEVQVVFAGHLHSRLGPIGIGAPGFLSGSASSSTYLIAEYDNVRREVRVYTVRDNDPFRKELVSATPYRDAKKSLPPVLPKPAFGINVRNAGGYNAKYRLRHVDAAGQRVEKWSGELPSGSGHLFAVPGSATNVEFHGEARTGLVWAMWKTIFDERLASMSQCFQTWGTTLAPKYSKELCGLDGDAGTTLVSEKNGQCLDIQNGLALGNGLITWPCHGAPNQVIEVVGEELQVGGRCLDVANGDHRKGGHVVLWNCHGGANQRWRMEPNGRIRSLMPGPQMCLDVIAEEGNRVGLWDCHATSQDQRFYSPRKSFGPPVDEPAPPPDQGGNGGGDIIVLPGAPGLAR